MGVNGTLSWYLLRRVGQAVFVVWAAFTVSFVILYLLPSDPIVTMLGAGGDGTSVDPVQIAALREEFGFDQPVFVQYLQRLGAAVQLDFGTSMQGGKSVSGSIAAALPETIKLASVALVFALIFGTGIAVIAASTRSRWLRQLLLSLPPLGVAIPVFWFGLLLLQWFSFRLPLFPATGNKGLQSLVLPAIALAVPTAAVIAQVLSKSLMSTWQQPFVETLRATGASRFRIATKHVIRNGAIPVVTMIAIIVGSLLAGSVVTETVFSRSGVGQLTQSAVQHQDIPMVQGVVVLSAVVFVSVNLLVDLVYPLIDPRIVAASVTAK